MSRINLYSIEPNDVLAWPSFSEPISLESRASKIIVYFQHTPPIIVNTSLPALDAEQLMQHSSSHIQLVVDAKTTLVGILSKTHISRQEIIKKRAAGFDLKDLTVRDFYQPLSLVMSFNARELEKFSVGDVIDTLKWHRHPCALVTDKQTHKIIGLISLMEIAQQLNMQINLEGASTFIEAFNILHGDESLAH